ncbi:MAG: cytochrome c biogenesis protein ResB, partial [Nakamurella sp.]
MTVRDTSRVGGDQELRNADDDRTEPDQAELNGLTPEPPTQEIIGQSGPRRLLAGLRNIWRQLTSMRTALILLFLLAIASLPGALLPQWSLNSAKTAQYLIDHPTLGPLLDKFGFFEVFGSPWYAAIYLLLFTSLVGCLLPRTLEFVGQLRMPPVATPRNLGRLPHHHRTEVEGSPDAVADRITGGLRGWRVVRRVEGQSGSATAAVTLSAERGYLREIGNLVFHLSLLGLLVAIAVGKIVGYEGSVIVNTGSQFCSTSPASYDNFRPGLLVDGTQLSP